MKQTALVALGIALLVAFGAMANLRSAAVHAITPTVTPTDTATPTAVGATATPVPVAPADQPLASSQENATPALPLYAALDCDVFTPGVQDTCVFGTHQTIVDVAFVLVNNSGSPTTICCFNFGLHNPDLSGLEPVPGADSNLNANPKWAGLGAGPWSCTPPPPDPLSGGPLGGDGPGTSVSFISCYTPGNGAPLANGAVGTLATTRYEIPQGAEAGAVELFTTFVAVYDNNLTPLTAECPSNFEADLCQTATIIFVEPGIEKIPEGNAENVDLDIPAANLWICELGPCAGPGEGELIVFEYAHNVQTGDQNNDTITDGLGAYEFTVEYDNFVISSVIAQDIVFNAGPISPYPNGADGVPDGAGAARGPASCGMSIFLENLINFACASTGQIPGPTGSFDVARLILIPHEDLSNDLFPGNDNGIVTIIKDNGCELVDVFGHPIPGSINGGLTPLCGDLAITVRILEGDINLDCEVDVVDSQLIGFRYGGFFGSLLYSKWYDLEPNVHDLDIDIKDVQKVFGRQGSTCQAPIQAQPPLPPPAPFGD